MVSLKINSEQVQEIINKYQDYQEDNKGEYIIFFAKYFDNIITIYQSKKGYKVTFLGDKEIELAKEIDVDAEKIIKKESFIPKEWVNLDDQIGSDEVGVGDFFLPLIVVAAYVKKEDITRLKELGVSDSKKLNDEYILKIGPTLVKEFTYSKLTLDNALYNELINKGENINSMKAKMHNKALNNLHHKYQDVKNIFIDEFVKEDTYYRYLTFEEEILRGITFKNKGESYFPSVALASNIARYSLLIYKKKLDEKYHTSFPFGASKNVDEFAKKFIDKFGMDELKKLVKLNFANFDKLA